MKFPRAAWHGPIPNMSPGPISPRLVVVHIMQGTLSGTDSWFHDRAARVSAHFGVGKDGSLVQWVDASDKAWAEAAYNSQALSVENEGHSGDTLTPPQVEQDAQVLAWAWATFGVPLQVAPTPAASGLIGHGQLGVTGGNHPDCPGAPVVAQFGVIVDRAAQIAGRLSPVPNSLPVMELDVQIANAAKTAWLSAVDAGIANLPPNGGYELHADGGIDAVNGAPFYGGYFNKPESTRNAPRVFLNLTPRSDGQPGYVIWGNDGAFYAFGPDLWDPATQVAA